MNIPAFVVLFLSVIVYTDALTGNEIPSLPGDGCVTGKYPPHSSAKIPSYVINLDTPPQDRWNQVGQDKAAEIKALLAALKSFLLSISNATQVAIDFIDKDLGYLVDVMPQPYADEIRGLAAVTNMPLGEIFLYNAFYEVFTVCTSIVAQDPNGKLYHARNLDFGLFIGWDVQTHDWLITETLRPMIVNLDFQKAGKTVYKTVSFAGYIGAITGIKPGVFTLSMNERFNLDGGYIGILKWLLGDRTSQWVGFAGRQALETAPSYSAAKQMLTTVPLLAPCYFILGGNQTAEGAIITRGRTKAEDVWSLGQKNSSWYLLETNYDNWENPPFYDDRRTPGKQCMNKMTQQNVGFAGIFNVLSSKPNLNKLTVYTALMQVNSGQMESYIQKCEEPCSPW